MDMMVCMDCGWQGDEDDLLAPVSEPQVLDEFTHCPECENTDVKSLEEGNDFMTSVSEEEQRVRY